jgi:hypothetical protein
MLLRAPTSANLRSRVGHCCFKLRRGQGRCEDGVGAPAVEQGGEPRLLRRVGARPRRRRRRRPPRRPRASSSLGLPAAKSVRRWRLRILGVSIFYCARPIRRYGAREMEIVLGDCLSLYGMCFDNMAADNIVSVLATSSHVEQNRATPKAKKNKSSLPCKIRHWGDN